MKGENRKFQSSIKNKMISSFLLVMLFNMLIISIVIYVISTHYLKNESVGLVKKSQDQRIYEITQNMKFYENLLRSMSVDQDFTMFMRANYSLYRNEYFSFTEKALPLINSILNAHKDGIYIHVVRYKENATEYMTKNYENIITTRYPESNYIGAGTRFYTVSNISILRENSWFNEIYNNSDGFTWKQVGFDNKYGNISLLYELADNQEKYGLLRVGLDISVLLREMESNDSPEYQFFVFDAKNQLLTGDPSKRDFYEGYQNQFAQLFDLRNESKMYKDNLFIYSSMNNGWSMVTVVSASLLFAKTQALLIMIIITGIFTAIIFSLIIVVLSNNFTFRITKIVYALHTFKDGNFSIRIDDNIPDEIGYMANSFNEMSEEINELITNNYSINIQKKDEALKALQAQINPHMLFNSLSAVFRLAERNDLPTVKKMIMALSNFYRLTLNSGKDYYRISDEIEHVKNYIEVMKIRKSGCFEAQFHVESEVLRYYTIKVILQPFVENVFKHAMSDVDNKTNIDIYAYADMDDIVFEVNDDGIGIKELEKNEFPSGFTGYGIKNVNERLKLYFGDNYGVTIHSTFGSV